MPSYSGLWTLASQALGSGVGAWPILGPSLDRGVVMGGGSFGFGVNIIDYVTISTLGNASDFGDLISGEATVGCVSNSTRGVGMGGDPSTNIQYITFSSTGNALSFGSLPATRTSGSSASNNTRGLYFGGSDNTTLGSNAVNTIYYITIATLGNALIFGALSSNTSNSTSVSSTTRAVICGGSTTVRSTIVSSSCSYVTIATTGNTLTFGDLLSINNGAGACYDSIRGIIAGNSSSNRNVIQYITISTLGNAIDFGDLLGGSEYLAGFANFTRGVFAGGGTVNTIQYITIQSTGNAADFGDLTRTAQNINQSGTASSIQSVQPS